MNKHVCHQVVICISFSFALLIPQTYVHAEDQNFVEIPLEEFHDGKPIELRGLISSQTLNIPIPQSWSPEKDNWIEITPRVSSLLDVERSSLTISLNDSLIGSYLLKEIMGLGMSIPIPASRFSRGNNTLTFTGTLYLPDDLKTKCQNWDDASRWLALEPGGRLHLSFTRQIASVDLSSFPQGFVEPLERYLPEGASRQTLFVLPDQSTEDDLTSLSAISYILGSYADLNYHWSPEIVNAREFTPSLPTNRNIIFIGEAPSRLQDTLDKSKDYITLFPSPWAQGYAVMVLGDPNREDGFSPAFAFSDPIKSILLHGNVAYVDQYSPPDSPPFENSRSFADLGYLDRTVRGIGEQSLIYGLYLPYDVEPFLAKLNLGVVHSPDLDIQNSSFTVYLNGISVAGILPTARSSTGEPISVGLPAGKFHPGINFIRIRFDLHVPYGSCERAPESVWATVLSSSTLEINSRERSPIPSLKYFPQPFSDYAGFAYVIPDHYDQNDLRHISQLSFMIGSSSYQIDRLPEVITARNFQRSDKDQGNVILLGLPSQNSALRSANDWLPQPFVKDGDSLQEGYGVYLPTVEKEASLGLMQIIPSPWQKGGTILAITGNDQEGLEWTWGVLLNPALRDQFAGNVMVVGAADRSKALGPAADVQNLQSIFQQIADAGNIPIIGSILQRGGQAFLGPALAAVGSALLLVIGIVWIYKGIRSRSAAGSPKRIEEQEDHET